MKPEYLNLNNQNHSFLAEKPVSAGEYLEFLLAEHKITIPEFAAHLNVKGEKINGIIEGTSPVTRNLALKLEAATKFSAMNWLAMQQRLDLFEASKTFDGSSVTPLDFEEATRQGLAKCRAALNRGH
ncbi:MAG: HigA family addiction module antitoxin [SAR324 cluster bacterium]|nr:HigA family addiction module antitoxin [SAR324 cluster bacterium]